MQHPRSPAARSARRQTIGVSCLTFTPRFCTVSPANSFVPLAPSRPRPRSSPIPSLTLIWPGTITRRAPPAGVLPGHGRVTPPAAVPSLLSQSGATAIVDAADGWGQPAMWLATRAALDRAREHGLGAAVVHRSYHIGRVALYVESIAREGMIGQAMANAAPAVAPFGGRSRVMGTNPMAWAVPRPWTRHPSASTWPRQALPRASCEWRGREDFRAGGKRRRSRRTTDNGPRRLLRRWRAFAIRWAQGERIQPARPIYRPRPGADGSFSL